MTTIPLIQPSAWASTFSGGKTADTVFSTPTVNIEDSTLDQDQLIDQDEEHITEMRLDPSPIGKGISVKEWAASNRTLAATFRPSTNELAVYVAGKKAAEEFPIKQSTTSNDNTVFLCQATIPEGRVPFITQTSEVFRSTTDLNVRKNRSAFKSRLGQYYEIIKRYLLKLYEESKNSMDTGDTTENESELDLIEGISAIWRLAEFMFFTNDQEKPIAFMYSDWLAAHDAGLDPDVGKRLLESPDRLSRPEFWPYIHQCLLRGMGNTVVFIVEQTLNEEKSESVADALETFLRLLRGIPVFESHSTDGELSERHRKWSEECEKYSKSAEVLRLGEDGINAARILAGDIETILELTESWEEAFAALLLYTSPDCRRDDLISILSICVERYLESVDVSLLERIKIAILEMDAIKALRLCGNYDPWLVAHFADALQQYGYLDVADLQLQGVSEGFESDIRDFFITSYAHSLMSNPKLWEVIARYLVKCGNTGKAMLSEWICHVPLESTDKALKVLKFCQDNDLTDAFQSIHRVLGVQEANRGQYALALQHFVASNDSDRVAMVTDELMENYLKNGVFELDNTLTSISKFSLNGHVEFLQSYDRFLQEYKDGHLTKSGRTLMNLLRNGKVPIKYWAAILFDALPLLENKQQVVFDSSDTNELMWCLEEIVVSQHKAECLQLLPASITSIASTVDERELQLNVIRLSLVRNLARSLVHPPMHSEQDVDM